MRMSVIFMQIVFAISGLSAMQINDPEVWKTYKSNFGKFYDTAGEDIVRKAIFENAIEMIVHHNLEENLGMHSFRMGINQFADLTTKEFTDTYTCIQKDSVLVDEMSMANFSILPTDVPDEIDYRKLGAVTEIRNQDDCGCCYAFAVVANVESMWQLAKKELLVLSPQQLVDCSKNKGCSGGSFETSFDYIKEKGLELDKDYPYMVKQGECKEDKDKMKSNIQGYERVPGEEAMKVAVATKGPVANYIAGSQAFQLYKGGILTLDDCPAKDVTHAVVTVGYGTEDGKDYWLIKNSYSTNWGEKGYARIERNKNTCSINDTNIYAVV